MTAPFNPGDDLRISTASYRRRGFEVVASNSHRTELRGVRGAPRVLVHEYGNDQEWSIFEDDGGQRRSQQCVVEAVNGVPYTSTSQDRLDEAPATPAGGPANRPLTAHDLATLVMCETASEVAGWVMGREATHACVTGDQRAADTAAAMKLYLTSVEIRRQSEGT